MIKTDVRISAHVHHAFYIAFVHKISFYPKLIFFGQIHTELGSRCLTCFKFRVLKGPQLHRKATNKFLLDSLGELLDNVAYARQIVKAALDFVIRVVWTTPDKYIFFAFAVPWRFVRRVPPGVRVVVASLKWSQV